MQTPPRELQKDGTWFRDADGRYLLLRGVNFGSRSKLPPYLPIYPIDPRRPLAATFDRDIFHQEIEKSREDLDRLSALGFNVVRLLVIWKGIEPVPNPDLETLLPEGEEYLRAIATVIDELYARGLYVVLDFHQDIAHEIFGGDGFPDWAVAIDRDHPRFPPSNLRDPNWGLYLYDTILSNGGARHTLNSFWRNSLRNTEFGLDDFPVQTHLVKTIGQAARFFQSLNDGNGHPAILGYSPFNEPHPVGLGKREFETNYLPRFYSAVLKEIRRFDAHAFFFIEPRMDWTTFSAAGDPYVESHGRNFTLEPETFLDISSLDDDRLVFSFHYYDPWTLSHAHTPSPFFPYWPHGDDMTTKEAKWSGMFHHLTEAALSRELIPFLSEFGGDHDWQFDTPLRPAIYKRRQVRAYIDLQFRQVEENLLNATYWNYDLYNSTYGKDNWNLENYSLLGPGRVPRQIDLVARPYPLRSSARPSRLWFDPEPKIALIVLDGKPVPAPSIIYIPGAIHYPDGFEVHASGSLPRWDAAMQHLHWLPDPESTRNVLVVTPIGASIDAALPPDLADLLPGDTRKIFR